ncbi:Ig-like domain-containing protein, partial [Paraglaciecola arctica]|uniref:Ig-like domain-containing protein n=1 Tax=Paraglaciecola arctica TaxID=1128911 RepID=UPI001C07140B
NVANVNVPPIAEDDIFSVDEGNSVSGNVITHNDGDGAVDTDGGDGGALSVTHVNGIALVFDATTGEATVAIKDGTLLIKADGSFTYNNIGYVLGTAAPSFNYTLSDGIDSDIGAVTINVIDYAPDAIDDVNYIQLTQLGDTDTANRNGVKGNVITTGSTGDNADTSVDGFGTPIITQVEYNGSTFQFSDTVSSHAIDTGFGVLTISSSGAYNFVTPKGMQIPDADMNLVFTYTIQDGDLVNPEEDSADLTINIKKPVAPEPLSNELDLDFQQTSTTIDTTFDAKVALQADKLAFKFSPDLDGLGDILTEANTDGLETYLAAIGEDNPSKVNIELTSSLKDSPLDDAKVLSKEQSDQEFSFSATVTNGLLEGGGTIISDQAAATSAPIAEFDSAELL